MKCDEAKPACTRCTSTGRHCDGYTTPPPRLPRKQKPAKKSLAQLAAPQQHALLCSIIRSPSPDIPGTTEERRSFHYFRSRAVGQQPGTFEPYFWGHLVLQFSHQEPAIRACLVALSAIYEERVSSGAGLRRSARRSPYALQQYVKAIQHFTTAVSSKEADVRVVLVMCLIFIWTDMLQDNLSSAFQHLECGLQVLTGASVNPTRTLSLDVEDIYGSLVRSFTRITTQAAVHGRVVLADSPSTFPKILGPKPNIPENFYSVSESRVYLDNEMNTIFGQMRDLRNSANFATPNQLEELFFIDGMCAEYVGRLEKWQAANAFLRAAHGTEKESSSGMVYLQLYYTLLSIILRNPFAPTEMIFDSYTSSFDLILTLCQSLLDSSTPTTQHLLSFDIGVLPPLFFTVLKCREPRIRNEALGLLKLGPEQEGLWQRESMAVYAEWKVAVEEQGRDDLPLYVPLPNTARISQERLGHKDVGGKLVPVVRFRRGGVPGGIEEEIEISAQLEEIVGGMGNTL